MYSFCPLEVTILTLPTISATLNVCDFKWGLFWEWWNVRCEGVQSNHACLLELSMCYASYTLPKAQESMHVVHSL